MIIKLHSCNFFFFRKRNENLEESLQTMKQLIAEKDARIDDFKSQLSSLSSHQKPREREEDEIMSSNNNPKNDARRYFKYTPVNSYPKERHSEEPMMYKTPIKQANDSFNEDPISHSVNYNFQSQKDDYVKDIGTRDYYRDTREILNNREFSRETPNNNREYIINNREYSKDYNNNNNIKRSPIKTFQKSPFPDRSGNVSNNNVMDLMKSTTSIQYKAQEVLENYELEDTEKLQGNSKNTKKYYRNVEERGGNNIPVPYDDFMNSKQKKILRENNQEKINEDILNILMQLNKEKSIIEEKLAELEKRLSESENANDNLQYEKEKLKNELVKIYQELKIAKSGLQLEDSPNKNSNQKQIQNKSMNNDKEATLKTEIKFLINKLLKAKGKLVKEKNDLSFKDSGQKQKNYYSSTSANYEIKRSSDQKKKVTLNSSMAVTDTYQPPQRSKTPVLYKETKSRDVFYVKENVSHI